MDGEGNVPERRRQPPRPGFPVPEHSSCVGPGQLQGDEIIEFIAPVRGRGQAEPAPGRDLAHRSVSSESPLSPLLLYVGAIVSVSVSYQRAVDTKTLTCLAPGERGGSYTAAFREAFARKGGKEVLGCGISIVRARRWRPPELHRARWSCGDHGDRARWPDVPHFSGVICAPPRCASRVISWIRWAGLAGLLEICSISVISWSRVRRLAICSR